MMNSGEGTPAVSVIVLTYNQVATALRALESVAEVAGRECEVIVSDDGSTDGTREALETYADKNPGRIRLLPRHANMGLTDNYFYALRHCRGRYITDLAGDDSRINPTVIGDYVRMLDAHPEAVAVSSRWLSDGKTEGNSDPMTDRREMMIRLLSFAKPQPMMLSAILYRKSVIDKALTREKAMVWNDGFRCEDLPVMMALLDAGEIIYRPEVAVEYSPSAESVTSTRDCGRRARYAAGLCRASVVLSHRYGFSSESRIRKGIEDMCAYMLACAAASGEISVADEALRVCRKIKVKLSYKSLFYKTMLRSRGGRRSIAWLKSLMRLR